MYPNYPNQGGFPSQPPYPNFPSQPGSIGFNDPMNNAPMYPNQSGYPPQSGFPVFPSGQSGFPSQPAYPSNPGFPPSQPNYPGQQSYPSFPPSNPGYPAQPGYPSSQPPSNPSYPNQTGYPSSVPPSNPSYPNQTGYPSSVPPSNPGYLPAHIAANPNFQPTQYYGGPPDSFGSTSPQQNQMAQNPSLRPYQPFNPSDDAQKLYKAMKGFGTDETTLIDILCRRTWQQRQQIAQQYKSDYGKDLLKNIKDETKGNFELVFKALLFTPIQLEVHDLKKSVDRMGTDEEALIDIMCTKTNAEMMQLKNTYQQMYRSNIEKDVAGDASGYFRRFLVSLMASNRSDSPPDYQRAVQQAQALYQAGEKRMGTNEVEFNRIFASESYAQLRIIFEEYYKLTGHDIEKVLRKEMSGDVERAFLAIAQIAKNPQMYYANRLHETMASAGTKDRSLIRLIVLRSEIDMLNIKSEYQRKYGKTLEQSIKSDCSGDYKRALLCLVGDPNWR
ncbi:annexin B9-like isoform X1 [Brachionus plicatilis]|uniref:Annexin n=1 Tax=Brachionus plicatilis TaxID=10195 RepID=A0A3M7T7J2_BRAPC|nr:annexin B9-like isoform X1 [Brachionus plicatilis]